MTAPIVPQPPRSMPATTEPAAPTRRAPPPAARFADILDGMRDAQSALNTATFDETGMFGRRGADDGAPGQRSTARTAPTRPAAAPRTSQALDATGPHVRTDAPEEHSRSVLSRDARNNNRADRTPGHALTTPTGGAPPSPTLFSRAYARRSTANDPAAPRLAVRLPGRTTDVHVALHATELGLRVIARTGKLSPNERASLREAIAAMLHEHGIAGAHIEIAERADFTEERNDG